MQSKIQEFQFGPLFPQPLVNQSIDGNHLPGFSHWGVQLAADYSVPLSAGNTLPTRTSTTLCAARTTGISPTSMWKRT